MSSVKKRVLTIQVEKTSIDTNRNESILKLKHQSLYPSETTVLAGDSVINGVIEEKKRER